MIDFLPKNDTYATHEPHYPDVVCRTLIANNEPAGGPTPSPFITGFLDSMEKLRLASEGKTLSTPEDRASGNPCQVALSFALSGRRAFFTRKKYLAIGPPEIKEGAGICLF
jgi:hypothetical protein